jgi:parallel beta helix pectate lyase-like protein
MMISRSRFAAAAAFATVLATASLAHAQATRTWISGVGDDVNPCSRTAPCKTFPGAISKTAPSGEIDTLDPGGFGAVTITKSITLDGTSGIAGILVAGTNGIVIQAGASDVVILRNLDINGIGQGLSGIRIISARDVYVENCKIYGFTQRGISDERNSGRLFVSDTNISSNSTAGIGAVATTLPSTLTVTGDHVRVERQGNAGVLVGDGTKATFSNSVISGNVNFGVYATGAGAEVLVDASVVSANGQGLATGAGGIVRVSNSSVTANNLGINTAGGGSVYSYGQNRLDGNTSNGSPSGSAPLQ